MEPHEGYCAMFEDQLRQGDVNGAYHYAVFGDGSGR